MKTKLLKIIFVLIMLIGIIPTFSMAADFWCRDCDNNKNDEDKDRGRSLTGIYHAMINFKEKWITTNVDEDWLNEWMSEVPSDDGLLLTDGMIKHKNAICVGHGWTEVGNGVSDGRTMNVIDIIGDKVTVYSYRNGRIITIEDKSRKHEYYKLAYFAKRATEETKPTTRHRRECVCSVS